MLQSGLTVFGLGFGMVFCVLILLILMIGLISKAAGLINKMVPQKEEKPALIKKKKHPMSRVRSRGK